MGVALAAIACACGADDVASGGASVTTSASGEMSVETGADCPELVLDEDLRAWSLDATLDLPLYTHVRGPVSVTGAGITDLQFLRCLREVDGELSLSRLPDLEHAVGLERVERVGRLYVRNNDRLVSLDALESLREIEGLSWIDNNNAMVSLGLPALEIVTELEIGHACSGGNRNFSLTEIGGLESLRQFGSIIIGHNTALVSIEGLRGLAERVGPPPPGFNTASLLFKGNEQLPIEYIRDVLKEGDDQGLYNLHTACNQGEEPCELIPCP